jgi:hypothetical protein
LLLPSAAPALMVFTSGFRHTFLLTGDLLDPKQRGAAILDAVSAD